MRGLLFALAAWAPLDSRIPGPFGLGIGTILLALLAVLLVVRQPDSLVSTLRSGRLLALYLFLGTAVALELAHPGPSLGWWWRLAQLGVGIVLVATAAGDGRAVRAALHGLVAGGTAIALLLATTSWTTFAAIDVADYTVTQQARADALQGTIVSTGSINTAAFYAGAAGAVALALALVSPRRATRLTMGVAATTCFVGTAFSVSRGALLAGALAALVPLFHQRRHLGRRLTKALIVVVALVVILPPSVFGRVVTTKAETTDGKDDPRVVLWQSVGTALPEVAPFGIGAGQFASGWALDNGFGDSSAQRARGTHSSLTQILVYWGVVPLGCFVLFVGSTLRRLPRSLAPLDLRLPVLTFAVALAAELFISHSLHGKQYAIGFGLALALLHRGTRRRSAPRAARAVARP